MWLIISLSICTFILGFGIGKLQKLYCKNKSIDKTVKEGKEFLDGYKKILEESKKKPSGK